MKTKQIAIKCVYNAMDDTFTVTETVNTSNPRIGARLTVKAANELMDQRNVTVTVRGS